MSKTTDNKEVKSREDKRLEAQAHDDIANTVDVTLKMVTVIVRRGGDQNTGIPSEVFEHELPILEAIHGQGNVEEVSSREVSVTNLNAGSEYDRLLRKYERSEPEDIVRKVYGNNPRELAQEIGIPYNRSNERSIRQAREAQGALVIVGGESATQIAPTTEIAAITTPAPEASTIKKGSPADLEAKANAASLGARAAKVVDTTKAKPKSAEAKKPAKVAAKSKAKKQK